MTAHATARTNLSLPLPQMLVLTENIKTDDTELFIAEPQIYNYDESAGHVALLAGSYSGLALTAAVGTCNLREVASDP